MTKARLLRAISLALMCLCLAIGVAGAILGVGFGDDPACHAVAFALLMAFLALLPIEIAFDFVAKRAEERTD